MMLTHTKIIVRKAGETLEAAGAGDDVRDVLPLAGLDTLFDMHSNLAGACLARSKRVRIEYGPLRQGPERQRKRKERRVLLPDAFRKLF